MYEAKNLHTLARRYCMLRYSTLVEAYRPIAERELRQAQYSYSEKALEIYPRYNVVAVILDSVETLDSENLPDFDVLVQILSSMAWSAASCMTGHHTIQAARSAEEDERTRFAEHVESALVDEASFYQPPLFYRRTLGFEEETELLSKIESIWDTDDGYWYPLTEKPTGKAVEAFSLNGADDADLKEQFQRFFADNSIRRLYELGEDGPGCFRSTADEAAKFECPERYLVSKDLEWIAYFSHGATVTLGGSLVGSVTLR
ncbi:MAG: hypothetical protein AAF718_11480 [Pseudomonadota bacterium]